MKTTMITSLMFTGLALAACGKDSPANQIANQTQQSKTQAQLVGTWAANCSQKPVSGIFTGVKSSRDFFAYGGNLAKTTKLYSDDNCQTEIAEAAYTGNSKVEAASAVDGANLITLNYTNVTVTVSNADLVKALNDKLVPIPNCGINDWAVGAGRDVTSAAGGVGCPVPKAATVFDIIKTDGQSLQFGMKDATHDGSTDAARPVALDTTDTFTKQ